METTERSATVLSRGRMAPLPGTLEFDLQFGEDVLRRLEDPEQQQQLDEAVQRLLPTYLAGKWTARASGDYGLVHIDVEGLAHLVFHIQRKAGVWDQADDDPWRVHQENGPTLRASCVQVAVALARRAVGGPLKREAFSA